MKVKFKATNRKDVTMHGTGWDVDLAIDDVDGLVEFLEIQHEESFEAPLEWKVRAGILSAADGEGRFWCIIPVVEDA